MKDLVRDVAERAAWTFAQAFLGAFVVTDLSTAKTAALAGLAAAIAVVKGFVCLAGRRAERSPTGVTVRRLLVGVAAAASLLWPQPAGAQDHRDLFWSLTASQTHVAHCVQGTIPGYN